MRFISPILFAFFLVFLSQMKAQTQLGDQGVTFNNSKNDPNYPFMKEWQSAGVKKGIPLKNTLPIKKMISATNSDGIQDAIDKLNTNGETSVILLKNGIYTINKPINIKSNVILRAENKGLVKLNVTIRSRNNKDEKAFIFDGTENSGLEDLNMEYIPEKNVVIYDDRNVNRNKFCGEKCFGNNPSGLSNMYVTFVRINKNSKNCWVDNCIFKNSGSDPIEILGNNNTFRGNFIDACFNKGGGGNGYYDIRGDYNLIVNEKVRRIRHFTIQLGAKYNVVLNCDLEVDVNFHNDDDGFNLIEKNKIKSEQWRSWGAFASGGSRYGHRAPGSNNIIFNNDVSGKNNSSQFGGDSKVFVFDQYKNPRLLRNNSPKGGTFYPAILEDVNNTVKCNSNAAVTGLKSIANTKTSITVAFDEIEGVNIYELKAWDKGDFTGSINSPKAISFKGGSSSPLTISGLKPGVEYTLVLRGVCSVGKSTKISEINAVTKNDEFDGVYYIQNPTGDIRINSPSGRLINQANTSANSAKWKITKVNDYYTIKNLRNNEFLEVPYGACKINETPRNLNVKLGTYSKVIGDHQKWKITEIGNDYFIEPLHCNKAVDRPVNKSIILLWTLDIGNTNQNWRIVKASVSSKKRVNKIKNNITTNNEDVQVFPNPVNREGFTVRLANDITSEISVFDIEGKKVYQKQFTKKNINFSRNNIGTAGLYFMRIKQGESTLIKKIILQ